MHVINISTTSQDIITWLTNFNHPIEKHGKHTNVITI